MSIFETLVYANICLEYKKFVDNDEMKQKVMWN